PRRSGKPVKERRSTFDSVAEAPSSIKGCNWGPVPNRAVHICLLIPLRAPFPVFNLSFAECKSGSSNVLISRGRFSRLLAETGNGQSGDMRIASFYGDAFDGQFALRLKESARGFGIDCDLFQRAKGAGEGD